MLAFCSATPPILALDHLARWVKSGTGVVHHRYDISMPVFLNLLIFQAQPTSKSQQDLYETHKLKSKPEELKPKLQTSIIP
jgi:hypothetical protein